MVFTVDGSASLESRIAEEMSQIRDAALDTVGAENLTALVLGGGYGRGEGGIYVVDGEERVYNDYDFFVVVPYTDRGRRKWLSQELLKVKARFEPDYGIHVDFGPPMPVSELPRQPYELMFMELKAGYHVIYGPENVLDALPDYDVVRPPLEECARLFMNRGVGLLLAARLLRKGTTLNQEDHEFVVRNIYKAQMALGDSVYFIQENYSPSYVIRRERFEQIDLSAVPEPDAVRRAYADALAFKFRPDHAVPEGKTLATWHAETTRLFGTMFLWFERQRLGQPDLTWADYRRLGSRLPDLSKTDRAKNIVRNLRNRQGALPTWNELGLHPRDRILKRLPDLLFGDGDEEDYVIHLWSQYG